MKNLELQKLNVQELTTEEMSTSSGGFRFVLFGIVIYDSACPEGDRWWGC